MLRIALQAGVIPQEPIPSGVNGSFACLAGLSRDSFSVGGSLGEDGSFPRFLWKIERSPDGAIPFSFAGPGP
jgi:hypothetical protein